MTEILTFIGKRIKEATKLPFVIYPDVTVLNEPYLMITPNGLHYQRVNRSDYQTPMVIGIDVKVILIAQGSNISFLKYVLNNSLAMNRFFDPDSDRKELLRYEKNGTSYWIKLTYEKEKTGEFSQLPDGKNSCEYTETWNVQICFPIEILEDPPQELTIEAISVIVKEKGEIKIES